MYGYVHFRLLLWIYIFFVNLGAAAAVYLGFIAGSLDKKIGIEKMTNSTTKGVLPKYQGELFFKFLFGIKRFPRNFDTLLRGLIGTFWLVCDYEDEFRLVIAKR